MDSNLNQDNDQLESESNHEKISDLIDNKKIINTLRSIKTCGSINYEDIKLLPTLFIDMQEALKRSNANVLDLKETIKEKIVQEKKLKKDNRDLKEALTRYRAKASEVKKEYEALKLENINLTQNFDYTTNLQKKIEDLTIEKKTLRRDNEELIRNRAQLEEEVDSLRKQCSDLEAKNAKYKSAHGALKTELSNIEDHLEDVKEFQLEIKKLQSEMGKMKDSIKQLDDDKRRLKEDNLKYITTVKEMKGELKTHLNEKIALLKEIEDLKRSQRDIIVKEEDYKTAIANALDQTDKMTKEREHIVKMLKDKEDALMHYEEMKSKYSELFEDFNSVIQENADMRNIIQERQYTNEDMTKLRDKFETELFNANCEVNIWKSNFIEIAKYKLLNYDNGTNDIDNIMQIDRNYLQSAPSDLINRSSQLLHYFKQLVDQENYQSINLKQLKTALVQEQEKVCYMKDKLTSEMFLRRKIHNRYMYIRGNLRVMCRIRPFISNEIINQKSQFDTFEITSDTIYVNDQQGRGRKAFEFDYIFNTKSTQNEVYEEASLLVQSLMNGNNICIIAYGQTCTGKTYTIQGPDVNHPGIATRAAKELFELIEANHNNQEHQSVRLTLSIIEIYNEAIYNLLDDTKPSLSMYENANGNLVLPDLMPITIKNFTEASKLFKLASKFRHTSETDYNNRSSRSHCVFTFSLKIVNKEGQITRSTLNIIDLAGSERISKSNCNDEVIKKEGIAINLSLHALSTVLNSIAIKASHIPYRDSKLTHFLKESLNESYNIILLLHISPNVKDLSETISTLQFGTRIVKICKHKTGKEKIQYLNNNNSNSNNNNNNKENEDNQFNKKKRISQQQSNSNM